MEEILESSYADNSSLALNDINDWEETPLEQNTDLESINDWQEQPVNIPSYNIQNLNTGENIIAPATMDVVDVKFNQGIQKNGNNKYDYWGKVYQSLDVIGNSIEELFNSFSTGVVQGVGSIYDTALHYFHNVPYWQKRLTDAKKSGNLDDELLATQMLGYINGIRDKSSKAISNVTEILRPTEERDSVDNFLITMGNATTTTAGAIGASFLTKNPNLAATLMAALAGRMKYTEIFDKSIKEGLDYYTADLFSSNGAMIEGGIELVGDRLLLSAIKAMPFEKALKRAISKNDTLVRAGKKIVNKKSVLLGAAKGGTIEFAQEGSQNVLGALWETAIDDSPINWNDIFEQSLAAAIVGAGAGTVSTSSYNSFIDRYNNSFKESIKAVDETMSEEDLQRVANAGQEILLQISDSVAGQLDYLASKEIEPDNLPDKSLDMSKRVRDIIKDRYKLTDEEINKIATVATRSLNIRNEYNQATQYFYDKLVQAGIEAPQAADVARVFAAQAASNAIAEGISVKEAIDTQGFSFTKVEGEGKITKDEMDNLLFSRVGFHSSPRPIEGTHLTTKTDNVGAGGARHGIGNYVLFDKDSNKLLYFDKFNDRFIQAVFYNGQYLNREKRGLPEHLIYALDAFTLSKSQEEYNEYLDDKISKIEKNPMLDEKDIKSKIDEINKAKKLDYSKFNSEDSRQQWSVAVPDADVMLQEEDMLIDQSDFVQKQIEKANEELNLGIEDSGIRGFMIYGKISDKLGSDEKASEYLKKLGIKGIEFYGARDGHGAVIFEDTPLIERLLSSDKGIVKGYYNPTTKEIGFTESADVSTAIHEGMHGFEDNLRQRAKNGSEVAKKQIEAMKNYVGAESTDFTTEQSEKLARAFERYAFDGKAPNKTLKDTFDRFSNWLKNIYNTGEKLGKVTPELSKAFREMLGGRKLDTALQLGEILMNEKVKEGKITKKEVGNKIQRLLNWTKPRTVNGKLVGRFPDKNVNDFFANTREILSTKGKDKKIVAIQKIAQNLGDIQMLNNTGEFALEDGRDVDDLIWENKLLSIVAGKADVSLMAEVYNSLMETYNEGRVGEKVKKEARKARVTHLRDDAKDVIFQGKGKDWRKESSKLVQAGRRFGMIYQGWNGILDTLSMFDKTSKTGESKINQDLNVFKEETASRWGVYQDAEKLGKFLTKALGTGKSVSKYVYTTAKEKVKIEWGNNSKTFTRGQLIDIYMKSKDPETRKIMEEDNVLQYNKEFLARLEENLTDDDIKAANALFEFYRDNYDKVNAFYENKYGISLGKKEFYSPRSMQSQVIDVRNGDLISGASVSSFKQRTAKKGQISVKDAFTIANDYINSTNHYIAFSDKLSELNAVFQGDPVVRNAITNIFGARMNNAIKKEISRFATNNQKFLDVYDGVVSKVRSNYVASVLGGRPSITIKQLVSFPAYLEKMSVPEFISGVTEFALNPLEAMKIIGSTEYMKTRGFDINQDFQKISKSEALKKFTTRKGFKDFLMMNVQIGDRGAIYIGGYALYKSELKKNIAQGMIESEAKTKALNTVDKFTNETQQSSYMSEQSALQSNPYFNLFTMFQTAQNQYLRKELGAIRGLATGRMDLGEAAKVIGIYHFLLPMLFQYVSDFGRWDWDNQKRAAILGSFNGAFILSSILETGADWLVTGKMNRHDTRLQDVIPVWSVVEESSKFAQLVVNQDYDDITLEDVSDVLKQGAKTGGMLAGLPIKWFTDMGEIPDYIEDEEYGKALGAALGWTPYALNKD